MPQKTQTITVEGYDAPALAALSFGALESLGWTIKYAAEGSIIGFTPKAWNKYDHQVDIKAQEQELTISSKHIHGEIADLPGRNQKFIDEFITAFESIKVSATPEQISGWKEKQLLLQEETIKTVEEEAKQSVMIDSVMNLSKSNLYVTYGIIAINVLVFILMVVSGISIIQPSGLDIIKWGANFMPLTATGDWWRLVSCVFVHIGIIHLVFNMYALLMVGVYLEPMLGKTRFIIAYLCTGVFASLASLWWHSTPIASAGASGAIFGLYGVFLALLSTKLIPQSMRNALLKSIGIFVVYNLAYGMKSGVDNAAHIGGLLSGLIIGYIFYMLIKKEQGQKKNMVAPIGIVAATIISAFIYLRQEGSDVSKNERRQVVDTIHRMEYKDGEKFVEGIQKFGDIEERALVPLSDNTSGELGRSVLLDSLSIPKWDSAADLLYRMKEYDLPENEKKKIERLIEYVQLRKDEIQAIVNLAKEKSTTNQNALTEINTKMANLFEELKKL